MRANDLTKTGLVALSIALALPLIQGCSKSQVPETPMVQKLSDDSVKLSDDAIKNLALASVHLGEFPEKLSLMGKISVPEDRTVVVPARVTGRTDQIYVASGEVVRAGEPLCTIFSADFAVAREEFLQAVKQAQANPQDEDAQHFLVLAKKKLDALGISREDYEKWTGDSGNKSDELLVRAPRSGALLGKNAMIGNLVNVGDTLFMIGDLSKVWFAGDIYPEDLKKVRKNQEVDIDPGNGGPLLRGQVSFISPAVDPSTRTIKIRALIDNPGGELRADMYVQGDIVINTHQALIAPKSALIQLEDQTYLFKRLPGNVFKKIPVTVDGQSGKLIAIKQGLQDGDEIVSEGGLLLDAVFSGAGGDAGSGE